MVAVPSVEVWGDDAAVAVGFVPRFDRLVATVATVALAVELTLAVTVAVEAVGFAAALVVLGRVVGAALLGDAFDLVSLFLLFIMVETLWE